VLVIVPFFTYSNSLRRRALLSRDLSMGLTLAWIASDKFLVADGPWPTTDKADKKAQDKT
jgi:hypothetical protein